MNGGSRHCTGGGDQDHLQEKCKKEKWLSEALQIAEKRREAKGKGGKKRYTHWNAEFQRITRRAFIRILFIFREIHNLPIKLEAWHQVVGRRGKEIFLSRPP